MRIFLRILEVLAIVGIVWWVGYFAFLLTYVV